MGYKRMKAHEDGYYTGRHSCFLLQYHLVLVTKYRRPVISGNLERYLIEYTTEYFGSRFAPIMTINTMPDHIHILFETTPTVNLADFVNAYKSASARMLRREFEDEISVFCRNGHFWSNSYFIGSVSDKTAKTVERYIKHQKD